MELRKLFVYEKESCTSINSIIRNTYLVFTILLFMPVIFSSGVGEAFIGSIWLAPIMIFWMPIFTDKFRLNNHYDYLIYLVTWIPFVGLGILLYLSARKEEIISQNTEQEANGKIKQNSAHSSVETSSEQQNISIPEMVSIKLNGEEKLHNCKVSPKGNYAICYKQGHIDATGDQKEQLPGSLGLITIKNGELDEVVFESDKFQPAETDLNDNGEFIVLETDTEGLDTAYFYEEEDRAWTESFEENILSIGLSKDGLAVFITAPAWGKIYVCQTEGEKWVKKLPPEVPSKVTEVEFGDKHLNFSDHGNENSFSLTYKGELIGESIEKGFYGKLDELYSSNQNKNWEKTIELFEEEIIDHEKFDQVSQEAIYAAVAEAYYQLDQPSESIKFWKKAEKVGSLSNTRIKSMRKPYRKLLRNTENHGKKNVKKEWQYFLDKYGEFTSENDREMLKNIDLDV